MSDTYLRMRMWLMPIVLASCTGVAKDTGTGDTAPSDTSGSISTPTSFVGTACTSVGLEVVVCPPKVDVVVTDLIGDCGSTITSLDGEGTFGSDPAGSGDTGVQWCCYPVHQTESTCDYGRPYVSDGVALVSEVDVDLPGRGRGWCGQIPDAPPVHAQARRALQAAWEQAAQDEHAAVAAFSRITLELLAFGAPAELVDDTLQAAREEVVHAKLGFALASRYAGEPRTPGAFPLERAVPRSKDLATFAAATAREGCIGETVTVLVATECLARTTDPAVREVLSRIVADENGHAMLAWRTVRWALDVGGPEVRAAVAEVFADLAARGMPLPDRLASGPHRDVLVAHGLPDAALARAAIDRSVADVVLPAARGLLDGEVGTHPGLTSPEGTVL